MSNEHVESGREELKKTMSPAEVWALAVGAIIGWGCFVLPGARFLPEAGPIGSVLAFIVGGGLLCFVALAYSILVKAYPVAGGLRRFRQSMGLYLRMGPHPWLSLRYRRQRHRAGPSQPRLAAGCVRRGVSVQRSRLGRVRR